MGKVDFASVRQEIKDAARRAFDAVQAARLDETFYAFALDSDDSATTVCPSANTEQEYECCVKRYQADKSYMDFIASYDISFDSCVSNFRWSTAEWAYECEGVNTSVSSTT